MIYASFAFILGLCMAMWIYLPAMNYTPYSIRGAGSGGGTGFEYATNWSFSMSEMATFFIPSYYGFGGATYWGSVGVVSKFSTCSRYSSKIALAISLASPRRFDSMTVENVISVHTGCTPSKTESNALQIIPPS